MTAPNMLPQDNAQGAADAALSHFYGAPQPTRAEADMAPNPPEVQTDDADQLRGLLRALLGDDCPLLTPNAGPEAWVQWTRRKWDDGRQMVERHLWLVDRNRRMREGEQWISATAPGTPWREPPRAKEQARPVHNLLRPALDYRLQVVVEQRPGWRVTPATLDPDDQQTATAKQMALESTWKAQRMEIQTREAARWAQTDGVAFWHVTWDPTAGAPDAQLGGKPMGDVRTQTVRVEQVRVSRDATASHDPSYVIVREVIPATEAAARYGAAGAHAANSVGMYGDTQQRQDIATSAFTPVADRDRLNATATTERFTLYVAPQPDVLPIGLSLVVVGDVLVWGPKPLLWGVIPVIPVRDGTSDPAFFPRPAMEDWIDHQQRINALVASLVENIRVNKGGRFIARQGTMVKETFIGGTTSILEVNAADPSTALQPMAGFSVGQDVKDALALEVKTFEQKSGWNDAARGSFSADSSGRAILAQREQLERVFAPSVHALALAYTRWAEVCISAMQWGYEVPRKLQVVGTQRPDLAAALDARSLSGAADVFVDPESLMPMPRSVRLWQLDDLLSRGLMSGDEYRRRHPLANTQDLSTPDDVQTAKAERVARAILTGQPPEPIEWQDNEAIQQDVLERQIILVAGIPDPARAAARDRWNLLAQQHQQKTAPMAPAGTPAGPQGPPQGGAPDGAPQNPASQPLAASGPSIAAAPMGLSDQDRAAAQFEATTPG